MFRIQLTLCGMTIDGALSRLEETGQFQLFAANVSQYLMCIYYILQYIFISTTPKNSLEFN